MHSGLFHWLAGILGCALGSLVGLCQALLHVVHSGAWLRCLYWCALDVGSSQASWVEVSCIPWSVGHHLTCLLPSLFRQGQWKAQYWVKVFWPQELLLSQAVVPVGH